MGRAFLKVAERAVLERRLYLCELKQIILYEGSDPEKQARSMRTLAWILGFEVRPPHEAIIRHQNLTMFGGRDADLLLGYRGLGKSTVGTVTRAVKYVLGNPNIRILLTSDTSGAAQAFHKEIYAHLATNNLLIEMFGRFYGENGRNREGRFRDNESTVRQRTNRTLREGTFTCVGIGGQMASRHFDVIFADDLVTLEKSRTETQRGYLRAWYGSTLIGAFMEHTKAHYLGTRYYPNDLWQDMVDGRSDDGGVGALKDDFLKLKMVTILPSGEWVSNDPGKYSVDKCRMRMKQMGRYHFFAQMQQETDEVDGLIFNYSDLRWYSRGENEAPPRSEMQIFQYSDLAAKRTDTGDFFVNLTIGVATVDGVKRIWILDMIRERCGIAKQRKYILGQAEKWKPYKAGVEAVAFQAGFAEEIQEMTMLPIDPILVDKDKVFNARRVSHLVENHKVFLPVPDPETKEGRNFQSLIDELGVFPDGEHDDCVDAFTGVLILAAFSGGAAASPSLPPGFDDEFGDSDLLADY